MGVTEKREIGKKESREEERVKGQKESGMTQGRGKGSTWGGEGERSDGRTKQDTRFYLKCQNRTAKVLLHLQNLIEWKHFFFFFFGSTQTTVCRSLVQLALSFSLRSACYDPNLASAGQFQEQSYK